MHEHIRSIVEDLLNMTAESIALYKSINLAELSGMAPNTLNSIIQSKENVLDDLLKEFNKIYPSFKPAKYPTAQQPANAIYEKITALESKINTLVQNSLLPNIPSKGHDGIYTLAATIRSNSESSIVKLNNILHIRGKDSISEEKFTKSILPIAGCLEFYEKDGLEIQAKLCRELLEENKKLFKEKYNKRLIIYEPKYGDSYASLCSSFDIKLLDLIRYNKIKNPYSKIIRKYLIIITK